jgi:hypothetical protein
MSYCIPEYIVTIMDNKFTCLSELGFKPTMGAVTDSSYTNNNSDDNVTDSVDNSTAVATATYTSVESVNTPSSTSKKCQRSIRRSPRLGTTPILTGKRTRTAVELFSPDNSCYSNSSRPSKRKPKLSPKECMLQMEKKYLESKANLAQDPMNKDLISKSAKNEIDFYNAMVGLTLRRNGRTKWKGWELGYVKLCALTDMGMEYALTEREYFAPYFSIFACFY